MTLLIQNLILEVIIGILPFEREKPQKIQLDMELDYDYNGEYLNYVEIIDFISTELKEQKYRLLEEALQDLIAKLKLAFPLILCVSLSIKKPDILSNCIVGANKKSFFK